MTMPMPRTAEPATPTRRSRAVQWTSVLLSLGVLAGSIPFFVMRNDPGDEFGLAVLLALLFGVSGGAGLLLGSASLAVSRRWPGWSSASAVTALVLLAPALYVAGVLALGAGVA